MDRGCEAPTKSSSRLPRHRPTQDISSKSIPHIAIIDESGGSWYIVQALSSEFGLTKDSSFLPNGWDRFRLPAVYLVPRHD